MLLQVAPENVVNFGNSLIEDGATSARSIHFIHSKSTIMSLRPSTLPLSALSRSLLPRTPRSPFSPRFSSSTSSSTISPPSASESALARQIDWPTYLNLRKSSRVYGLIASIPTAIGFFGGASYFVRTLLSSLCSSS